MSDLDRAMKILAAQSAPSTFAEPEASSPTLDLDALLAQARTAWAVAPAKIGERLEAPDPQLINSLLAQASEFKHAADAATAERAKITQFLGDLIEAAEIHQGLEPGAITELTVNGATIFTYKVVESRVLNQVHLKNLFPDIEANAEAWTTSVSRRREYK